MYFPYFRGRQYELLALKELAAKDLITSSVIPVVEPVKIIPALDNALAAFQAMELPIGLVLNPNVGKLKDEPKMISHLLTKVSSNSNIIPSILLNESTDELIEKLNDRYSKKDLLVIFNDRDYLDTYRRLFDDSPRYNLCSDERFFRRAVDQNKVLFENRFTKKNRNADYPEEEFFSSDHLDYTEDDYIGFGDYSIVGKEYIESGFAPYAVAIHIVYFAEDYSLRIRHFISDSNADISDVPGKFYEAVSKLHRWYQDENQNRQLTSGLQTLLDHYEHKTYPGLPTLKKLSIMHHLELMGKFIDGGLEL